MEAHEAVTTLLGRSSERNELRLKVESTSAASRHHLVTCAKNRSEKRGAASGSEPPVTFGRQVVPRYGARPSNRAVARAERRFKNRHQLSEGRGVAASRISFLRILRARQVWAISFAVEPALTPLGC